MEDTAESRLGSSESPIMNFKVGLALALGYVALVAAFWLGRYLLWSRKPSLRLKLPPGPKGVPVFGSLFKVFNDRTKLPHQVLFDLSKEYGPTMSLRLGSRYAVHISTPGLAREVFKNHDRNFANRPYHSSKDLLLHSTGTIGYSLYNEHLKNIRKLCATELLSSARVQELEWVRKAELAMIVRSILAESRQHGTDADKLSPVNINLKMSFLTLNSMTRSLFGKRFFNYGHLEEEVSSYASVEEAKEFKELLDEILRLVVTPIFGDMIPYLGFLDSLTPYKKQMRKAHLRLEAFFGRVIQEHREYLRSAGQGKVAPVRDILDVMLSLADGAQTTGIQLDDDKIKGAIFDLVNGGTTTSSATVEWALAELLRAPKVLRKAQQELDSVIGRERMVAEADIPSLPYLQAVIKETLRLHPPVALLIPHESIEDCAVAGYHIPAKTTLFVGVWQMARSPDVWENPLEFKPERFEGSAIEPKGNHFELLPFGTGRRGCPGMILGLIAAQHALARLLQAFDWSLPAGQKAEDLDMSEGSGLSIPRLQPLWAVPQPRLPAHMYD